MFKKLLVILILPSILLASDQANRFILEEGHRFEHDDTTICYMAKTDLFIECCVQAAHKSNQPLQELFTKIKQPYIDTSASYVFMTPRDLFYRLLKNLSISRDIADGEEEEKFPPHYVTTLNDIVTRLTMQKLPLTQLPIPVKAEIGCHESEPTPHAMQQQNEPKNMHPIKSYDDDFEILEEHIVCPGLYKKQKAKSAQNLIIPQPFTSALLVERHPDLVCFELCANINFETDHVTHHQKILVLFNQFLQKAQ